MPLGAWPNEPPRAAQMRRALAREIDDPGWVTVGRLGALRLNRALGRELAPGHVLAGMSVTAVARATGADEVAFLCEDGRLAMVHMTWTPQTDPAWPSTGFYAGPGALADALRAERCWTAAFDRSVEIGATQPEGTFTCPDCGADWGAAEARDDCATCGGWGLARPCPVCDGACGAVWTRAVLDSLDAREAVWLGQCDRRDRPDRPDRG